MRVFGDFFRDVFYGLRRLRKTPSYCLGVILILGLGLGPNIALFSLISGILLRTLPIHDASRVVVLWESSSQRGIKELTVSEANFFDWQKESRTIDLMVPFVRGKGALKLPDGPEQVYLARFSASLFQIVSVAPLLGRTFTEDESSPGKHLVALLSEDCWRKRFAAAKNILGRTVVLDDTPYTVVGVLPASFNFPSPLVEQHTDIWTPLQLRATGAIRKGHSFTVIGRLRAGTSIKDASREMTAIAQHLERSYPKTNTGWTIRVVPLLEQVVGGFSSLLLILQGTVFLILLIACANVANLQLTQVTARSGEISVRLAIGGKRWRLVRQLLTENLILCALGCILGLFLAKRSIGVIASLVPFPIPRLDEVQINMTVVCFAALLLVVATVLSGVAPSLHAVGSDSQSSFSEKVRSGTTRSADLLRRTFIGTQISVSVVLLIAAGLLIRSFLFLEHTDLGYQTANVLTAELKMPNKQYFEEVDRISFCRTLLDGLRADPGIHSVAVASELPLSSVESIEFGINGTVSSEAEPHLAGIHIVSGDYFQTISIPLLRGRSFTDQDGATAPAVVISETMKQRFWPTDDPLGQYITLPSFGKSHYTIVGVARDIRREFQSSPGPDVYIDFNAYPLTRVSILLRTDGTLADAAGLLRRHLRDLSSNTTVEDFALLDNLLEHSLSKPRFYGGFFGVFASLAILLASAGLYAIMSCAVALRTHEIGIRMALGATTGRISAQILAWGLPPVLIGILVGIGASFAFTRTLTSMLHGVSPTDPLTYCIVSGTLLGSSLLAGYVASRRITRIDPLTALRLQ